MGSRPRLNTSIELAVAPALAVGAPAPRPASPPAVVIAHLVAAQAVRAADPSSAITRAATTTIIGITTTAATGVALAENERIASRAAERFSLLIPAIAPFRDTAGVAVPAAFQRGPASTGAVDTVSAHWYLALRILLLGNCRSGECGYCSQQNEDEKWDALHGHGSTSIHCWSKMCTDGRTPEACASCYFRCGGTGGTRL